MASRLNWRSVPVRVQCLSISKIFAEFGVPFYLKIDIEGQEYQCLKGLTPSDLSKYVSWEASLEGLAHLFWMRELGYKAFKCIDQRTFRASLKQRIFLDRVPPQARKKLRIILGWGAPIPIRSHTGREFQVGSSGPFGEETDGRWQSFDSLADDWIAYCRQAIRNPFDTLDCWFDFHASL